MIMKWMRWKNMWDKDNWLCIDDEVGGEFLMGEINKFRFIQKNGKSKWGYSANVNKVVGGRIVNWSPKEWTEGSKIGFTFESLDEAKEWAENTIEDNRG
jgi:hypothetical protein